MREIAHSGSELRDNLIISSLNGGNSTLFHWPMADK